MARPSVLVIISLVLSVLLVPCEARSRSTSKTGGGLPLLEKEEVTVVKEEEAQRRTECEGRWIHIHDLPPRFNTDLQSCNAFSLYDDGNFCPYPYIANHGLGTRTHNRSWSWYRTDPTCSSPSSTDASSSTPASPPYYAALDALPLLYHPSLFNSSALHGCDLADFLCRDRLAIWGRRGGHDHFLVLARPAWDFSQDPDADPPLWGTSFLHLPDFLTSLSSPSESRQKALADLHSMQTEKLEKLSDRQSQPESQLKFIIEAWLQIVECRRVLKWTYAYGFYLPEHEHAKRQFFEYLQGEAESGLERLHQCAEKELQVYLDAETPMKEFNDFRTKLAGLTSVTRNYFENLVRALETGLNDVGSTNSQATCSKTSSSKTLGGKSKSGKIKAAGTSSRSGGPNRNLDESNLWSCDQCTYANPRSTNTCQMCEHRR